MSREVPTMRSVLVLIFLFVSLVIAFVVLFRQLRPGPAHAPPSGSASIPAAATVTSAQMEAALTTGDIVDADGQPVAPATFPAHRLTFVYFGASFCAPCRQFTPTLVRFYRDAGSSRAFNLIMVDEDADAAELKQYADAMHMPWPFAKLKGELATRLAKAYAGTGIPDLVLLDADGHVLADSFNRDRYRGPQQVLQDYRSIAN
jgi:nucleoredoxin